MFKPFALLRTPANVAGTSNADSFQKALIDVISSKEGRTAKLAALGSLVKRPEGVPKLSVFLKSKPEVFKVDDKSGDVSLVK